MYSICICLACELGIRNNSKSKFKVVSNEIITKEIGMYTTMINNDLKKEDDNEKEEEEEEEQVDYGLKSIKLVDNLISDESLNDEKLNRELELKLLKISIDPLNDNTTKKNNESNGSCSIRSHNGSSISKIKKKDIIKNIKKIRSLFIEIIILNIAINMLTIMIIFYYYHKDKTNSGINNNLVQNVEKTWTFNCYLTNIDLIYNLFYLIWLLVLFINGKQLIKSECIFKYHVYIFYSLFIAITLGPITNIVGDAFLIDYKLNPLVEKPKYNNKNNNNNNNSNNNNIYILLLLLLSLLLLLLLTINIILITIIK
ncbi:hypothetical protein LY90DRAFT_520049 [Neocallimastix californiae]|uniref:Uncharacterized protein n=1 Tax=Neocallimastix californiae TaxID=1754190 RepID=A0A1Y1YI33_9FUNG|nr:hypothetical protein LY90DRAFT_520049 [Neocallimastix californiae]|eukprot:ORX97639.1 hypothetical protein LY90DRAFT_520049 [Neocallimastix californiae]